VLFRSQDEWTLTFQHQFGSNLVLGARAVYRDLNRLLETVGYVDPSTGAIRLLVMNPGHQTTPLLEAWRGVLPDYAPFPKPRRRYGALELLLDKRFADRWFLHANYTWSRLRGNTAAGYDRGIPELAPNATKEWDIPSAAWIANRYGYLPTDRTHQFKAVAGYRFDGGLLVGGTLRFDTGRPMDKIYDWPKKEVGYGKLLQVPRGTAGRLPSALTLNLHAEYTFKIKGSTLTTFVDAFNALNDQVEFRVEEAYYDTRSTYSEPLRRNPGWGKTKSRTEDVTDYYTTTAYDVLAIFGERNWHSQGLVTGDPAFDKVVAAKVGFLGFPMEVRTKHFVDGKDNGTSTLTTQDVEMAAIAPGTFVLPVAYAKTEFGLGSMMKGLTQANDEVNRNAGQTAEEDGEQAQPQPQSQEEQKKKKPSLKDLMKVLGK